MSRIGKQSINIPANVTIEVGLNLVKVKGPLGELEKNIKSELVEVNIQDGILTTKPLRNDKFSKALWGTYTSHLKNMLAGVEKPFEKKLTIEGVGFKWEVKGDKLQLSLGFSHPVFLDIPQALKVTAEKGNLIISGMDLEKVSLFAMQVRKRKPVEPYKGKGIRYEGEVVVRKQGKKSA